MHDWNDVVMANSQRFPDRQSIRLVGFDYTASATHFVTICVRDHQCVFGSIVDATMQLSEIGKIASHNWSEIARIRQCISLDEFIVMPNHIHGIITIMNRDNDHSPRVWRIKHVPKQPVSLCDTERASCDTERASPCDAPTACLKRNSLGSIIGQFKIATTKHIRAAGYPDFAWQRNYYERIIRDDRALESVCAYIRNNPANWARDRNNR